MNPINYYQLFYELLNRYNKAEIIIRVDEFNEFIKQVKIHNIYCNFDYSDLEEYASLNPHITKIDTCELMFYPSEDWIRQINHFTRFYKMPENKSIISELWENICK